MMKKTTVLILLAISLLWSTSCVSSPEAQETSPDTFSESSDPTVPQETATSESTVESKDSDTTSASHESTVETLFEETEVSSIDESESSTAAEPETEAETSDGKIHLPKDEF